MSMDMINEINELQQKLIADVRLMAKYGRELAQHEQTYKVALAQEALKLRSTDMPVTLIDKVVYGKVAKERFQRDTAEVMYRTAQESINATKLRIRILDAQIGREWSESK